MNLLETIVALSAKPPVYTPGTAVMWTDDHISEHLLATHLSQDTDLASRKLPAIDTTVNWLLEQVPDRRLDILDLGCGPGLYAERLAGTGHRVTGMDFSARSLCHARKSAAASGLGTTYLHQDYLTLDHENQYDLVLMVFTDFGVLSTEDRNRLLANIHRALRPGGTFVFDVMNTGWLDTVTPVRTWEAEANGFWRPVPHLVLSETFCYEKEKVVLNQYIVADKKKGGEVYRFYTQAFSDRDIREVTAAAGFDTLSLRRGLLPPSSLYRPEDVTFCSARRS